MSDALTLALAVLAVLRAAWLVSMDDGPFDVFARLRDRLGQRTWVGRGMACPICVSFWLAGAMALWLARTPRDFGLLWFGISGAVLIILFWKNGRGR